MGLDEIGLDDIGMIPPPQKKKNMVRPNIRHQQMGPITSSDL